MMAGTAEEILYRVFWEISGKDRPGGLSYLADVTRDLAGAIQRAEEGNGGVFRTLEAIGSTVFKNAFGAVPLIRGIVSLFGGGGDAEAPPPLVKFTLPALVQFFAAETPEGFRAVDYDQSGRPRVMESTQAGMPVPPEGTQAGMPAPQAAVTVNVQAMDARSFLDRSTEIAAAVREAMLNLNSINDVVTEL